MIQIVYHTQLQCVGSSTFSIIKSFVIIIWPLVDIIRLFYSQRAYVHCVCIYSVRTSTTRHFHLIFNIYYLFTYFCEQMIFVSFDKVFSVACMHVCMNWQAKNVQTAIACLSGKSKYINIYWCTQYII